jgi:redox-sensitive bicupin YhaK (pirin superfamily)
MKTWEVTGMEVEAHRPEILSSSDAARVIVLQLPAGEQLQEHRVHERAWVLVLTGELEITGADGQSSEGGPGLLAEFDPREPHEVSAKSDARLLLFLAPWPGAGHPGAMPLAEKSDVRERAQQRAAEGG